MDLNPEFGCDVTADVFDLTPDDLPGPWDLVWASPPCEKFSVLQIGRNWTPPPENAPRTDGARQALDLVRATVGLIDALDPAFFVVENPVGKLRTLVKTGRIPTMLTWERRTVTYCSYGAPWRKATDLWGGFPPTWEVRPRCVPTSPCHVPAARGSRTGVQGPGHVPSPRNEGGGVMASGSKLAANGPNPLVEEFYEASARRFLGHGDMRDDEVAVEMQSWPRGMRAAVRALVPYELGDEIRVSVERDLEYGKTWRTVPAERLV